MTPWTIARQGPLSMVFSQQEYWSRLPCPFPGDLPNSGIKPASSLAAEFFTTSATWEVQAVALGIIKSNTNESNDDDNEKANTYWALAMYQVLHSEMCVFVLSYLILTATLEVTIILTNKFYVIINIIKVI